MEKPSEQVLAPAVTRAPRERVGVPLGRRRVRQRAGVLVDSEREGGRLERRHPDLHSANTPTSVVVGAPSCDTTAFSGFTQSGRSPA